MCGRSGARQGAHQGHLVRHSIRLFHGYRCRKRRAFGQQRYAQLLRNLRSGALRLYSRAARRPQLLRLSAQRGYALQCVGRGSGARRHAADCGADGCFQRTHHRHGGCDVWRNHQHAGPRSRTAGDEGLRHAGQPCRPCHSRHLSDGCARGNHCHSPAAPLLRKRRRLAAAP